MRAARAEARPREVGFGAEERSRHVPASTVPVGECVADQLTLSLAIARRGAFLATGATSHACTRIELIRRLLYGPIEARPQPDQTVLIQIG